MANTVAGDAKAIVIAMSIIGVILLIFGAISCLGYFRVSDALREFDKSYNDPYYHESMPISDMEKSYQDGMLFCLILAVLFFLSGTIFLFAGFRFYCKANIKNGIMR